MAKIKREKHNLLIKRYIFYKTINFYLVVIKCITKKTGFTKSRIIFNIKRSHSIYHTQTLIITNDLNFLGLHNLKNMWKKQGQYEKILRVYCSFIYR